MRTESQREYCEKVENYSHQVMDNDTDMYYYDDIILQMKCLWDHFDEFDVASSMEMAELTYEWLKVVNRMIGLRAKANTLRQFG